MATTNLLQWNPTAVNQENDPTYLADSQRVGGATDPSIFEAELANKAFYQWSTYLTALFQAFANKGFTTSDSNINTLTAMCANFLTSADQKPLQVVVPYSPNPVFNLSLASSFRIDLTGNVTSSTATNVPPAGAIVTFYIVSTNPGAFSFVWPTNVVDARNVQTESMNNLFVEQFISDGSQLWPADTFVNVVYSDLVTLEVAQDAENVSLQNGISAVQGVANTALTNANNAASAANAAQVTANSANTLAGEANGSANLALTEIAALTVTSTANDVTSARAFGATYTNGSNKTSLVSVIMERSAGGGGDYRLDGFLNGVVVASNTSSSTIAGMTIGVTWMVPPGSTYSANPTALQGGAAIVLQHWEEWPFSL